MKEEHLSEIEIEKLSLRFLSEENKVLKPGHLESCSSCSQKFQFYLNYHRELDLELKREPSSKLDEFISSVLPSESFQLFYINEFGEEKNYSKENGSLILAARTKELSKNRYTTEAVFSNPEGNWLMRVMFDSENEKYLFYLLGQKLEKHEVKLVPANGSPITIIVDEHGAGEFKGKLSFKWDEIKISITPLLGSDAVDNDDTEQK